MAENGKFNLTVTVLGQMLAMLLAASESAWAVTTVTPSVCDAVSAKLKTAGLYESRRFATEAASPSHQLNLLDFEVGARDARGCRPAYGAFQRAFAKLREIGGGVLFLPRRADGKLETYCIDFPVIADQNRLAEMNALAKGGFKYTTVNLNQPSTDPQKSEGLRARREFPLLKDAMLFVPKNTAIVGDWDETSGRGLTRIRYANTSFPLFGVIRSPDVHFQRLEFVFSGKLSSEYPFSQNEYLDAAGSPGGSLGGPHELSTVIYGMGADRIVIQDVVFSSLSNDNAGSYAMAVNLKGKVVPSVSCAQVRAQTANETDPAKKWVLASGTAGVTRGAYIERVKVYHGVFGFLVSGQEDIVMRDIAGNYRGSWYQSMNPKAGATPEQLKDYGAPGHIIYFTSQLSYDLRPLSGSDQCEMQIHGDYKSKRVLVSGVSENDQSLGLQAALGTLALKSMDTAVVENVVSKHPIGLIQSLLNNENLCMKDMRWSVTPGYWASRPAGEEVQNITVPRIHMVASPPGKIDSNHDLEFRNISLDSVELPATIYSSAPKETSPNYNILFKNLSIRSNPSFAMWKEEWNRGIFSVNGKNIQATNFQYVPILPPGQSCVPNRTYFATAIQNGSIKSMVSGSIRASKELRDRCPDAFVTLQVPTAIQSSIHFEQL